MSSIAEWLNNLADDLNKPFESKTGKKIAKSVQTVGKISQAANNVKTALGGNVSDEAWNRAEELKSYEVTPTTLGQTIGEGAELANELAGKARKKKKKSNPNKRKRSRANNSRDKH